MVTDLMFGIIQLSKNDYYKFYTYMQEGNTRQSLWVNRKNIHRPIRYIAENINVNVSVVNFKIYFPSPPTDPDEFVVPPICKESPLPTAKHYMDFSQDFDDTENE